MNPVSSYNDFLEFLIHHQENNDRLIPIILIKPGTLLYLNRELLLEHTFDYFDLRTGRNVQFFIPGYAHYPDAAFGHFFAEVRPYNEDAIAVRTRRLGTIYYSDKDFVEFIEKLENEYLDFKYRGDTELLFLKYSSSKTHKLGKLDFSSIYRYNLTKMFYSNEYRTLEQRHRMHEIEHFLEDVILAIRTANDDKQLINTIDCIYEKFMR